MARKGAVTAGEGHEDLVARTRHRYRVAVGCVTLALASAAPARAEIVFLASGQILSVKSHRTEGGALVLVLRGGGEMTCDASMVSRIAPDEVPHPEDFPAAPAARAAVLASVPYSDIIERVAAEQQVDPNIVRAVIKVESAFQERARSRKGAMGLMQLMPETARQYGVVNPYDPASNIEAGIKHLKSLLQRFSSLPLALAAYNAGEAAVQRFRGIPPYAETRAYVASILRLVGA
jgi:Transglycosylase SLT domain